MQRKAELWGVRPRIWVFTVLGVTLAFLAGRPRNEPVKHSSEQLSPSDITSSMAASKAESTHPPRAASSHTNSTAALPAIIRHLSDPDANIRFSALEELSTLKLGQQDLLPLLIACLNDSHPRVRASAALHLGALRMSAGDAVPALKQLAFTDTNELVRSRAKDALYNIRFYDFGPNDF